MPTMPMAQQSITDRLTDAGLRVLETDGPAALTVRRLAAEADTSTMAVYTHFGGRDGVVRSIVAESFRLFADALDAHPEGPDAVADFLVAGAAYRRFALDRPQRYQLMFGVVGTAATAATRADLTATGSPAATPEYAPAFDILRRGVRRMIDAGRIRDDGDAVVAGRLWSLVHGAVTLEMAGFFGHDGRGLTEVLSPLTADVMVGLGDTREHFAASLQTAMAATAGTPPDGDDGAGRPG